jgi:hypothetical protein
VEILNPGKFIAGVRAALKRRPSIKDKMLIHGEVNYYSPDHPPIVDWALPEKIVMSKLNAYVSQQEYRIAFAVNDAFRLQNTRLRLVSGERRSPRAASHPERLIKPGRLLKLCKVHYFS